MIRNYGFDERDVRINPEDYVFGGLSELPETIFKSDGQWPVVLYEPQAEKYETQGCTIWGMQNQAEMFIKQVYGYEPNYDERFNYLYSDIGARGANPQNAYTSARDNGLINNEPLPDTFAEFKDTAYLTPERVKAGQDWRLKRYEFLHEWVRNTSKENIVVLLKKSPVAIAVTAWQRDDGGLYVDGGQPNTHWVVAYGYLTEYNGVQGIFLKVFDSYDHSEKILHPDHYISVGKRIYIRERSPDESIELSVFETLFKYGLFSYFVSWLDSFKRAVRGILDPGSLGAARSSKFAQLSRDMIQDAGGLCRMGMHKPTLFNPLNSHHVKSFHEFPEDELKKSNLVVLCRLHHWLNGHYKNWSDSNPDIIADCDALNKKIMHKP